MKQLLAEAARVVDWWGPCGEDSGHASGAEREEHQPNQPSKSPGSGALRGDNIKNTLLFSSSYFPLENEL